MTPITSYLVESDYDNQPYLDVELEFAGMCLRQYAWPPRLGYNDFDFWVPQLAGDCW